MVMVAQGQFSHCSEDSVGYCSNALSLGVCEFLIRFYDFSLCMLCLLAALLKTQSTG